MKLLALLLLCSVYDQLEAAPAIVPGLQDAAPGIIPDLLGTAPGIIGGTVAGRKEFPYQVSLQFRDLDERVKHICGGSILARDTVVTAAHCVYDMRGHDLHVVAGEWDRATKSGYEQYLLTENITLHQDYNGRTNQNDIALIKTWGVFQFNDHVQPVALPSSHEEIPAGTSCVVSGWGTTTEGGLKSDKLMKVSVPVVSHEQCSKDYYEQPRNKMRIVDSMICAGKKGKDSCQGDSGGPLTYNGELVGIVSWGYGCGQPQYPGVYTKVSYFTDWIKEHSNL